MDASPGPSGPGTNRNAFLNASVLPRKALNRNLVFWNLLPNTRILERRLSRLSCRLQRETWRRYPRPWSTWRVTCNAATWAETARLIPFSNNFGSAYMVTCATVHNRYKVEATGYVRDGPVTRQLRFSNANAKRTQTQAFFARCALGL